MGERPAGSDDAWKWAIRNRIWAFLEENDIARFPRPVKNRIPNFDGAPKTGDTVAKLPEYQKAQIIKVNPDTPQKPVRMLALGQNRQLLVPQPRLLKGFFSQLDGSKIKNAKLSFAATAKGQKELAKPISFSDMVKKCPKVDLLVVGSVAVNEKTGARVGKGEGFAELEYAVLREIGCIDEFTPVVTTVHDAQVLPDGELPPPGKTLFKHDVSVDIICTPTRTIRIERGNKQEQPTGIYWNLLSDEKFNQISVLKEVKAWQENGRKLMAKKKQNTGKTMEKSTAKSAEIDVDFD